MRHIVGFLMALGLFATSPDAKPLLNSSEETYASVCIAADDTSARLIEICKLALQEPGASISQRAQMRETLGYAYKNQDQFKLAEAEFQSMLDGNAASYRALRGLGWVAHERDDYVRAAELFEASVDLQPTKSGLAGLADSKWEANDISAEDAIVLFDAALSLDPEYTWARRSKGWVLLDVRRFDEALELFGGIVNKDPEDENALAGLLKANEKLDQLEVALDLANRGLQIDPEEDWFLSRRSHLLFKLDRYRLAMQDADSLIELKPDDAEGYVRKARPMAEQGARCAALSLLAEAEQKVGPDSYLLYWRASILLDDGQYDAAATQILRNAEGEDADFYDFELLSLIQYLREDYAQARVAVDRALTLDATQPFAIYYDAMLMLKEDKGVETAMARFDESMQAGLPDRIIGEFAGDLIKAGYYAHAIAIRGKYSN